MAGQENDALLLPLRLLGHIAQLQHLLAGHMDALVVRPQQQLRDHIVSAPDEGLALKLANHAIRQVLGDVLETLHNDAPALGALGLKILVQLVEQPLPFLDGDAHIRQLCDLGLEKGRGHDLGLDVLRETRVEDGLADDVVVGAPPGA
jgi:hypothetical protein